jgi:hypothetical protein
VSSSYEDHLRSAARVSRNRNDLWVSENPDRPQQPESWGSSGDFPNGASEPVHGDNHELVAFTKPAHAFHPARSVATCASGRGVAEDPVGGDASRRDGVVLLVDGLLPGGDPEVSGGAHAHAHKEPLGSDNSSVSD